MRKKLITATILVIVSTGLFFGYKSLQATNPKVQSSRQEQKQTPFADSKDVTVVSTKPDPLDNTIISANDIIEIVFTSPLENIGELKYRIEPKVDVKMELSSDRKTVKITPNKPYDLGFTYTLFIKQESKFDGGKRLTKELIYHYKTVTFREF